MAWFKRAKYGLQPAAKKKDIPDVWLKCENCGEILYKKEMVRNFFVCTKCDFHFRINSQDYINLLLDDGIFEEFNSSMQSVDVLKFKDSKRYSDRLKEAVKKSGLYEAVLTGFGNVKGIKVVLCVMDFSFVGGSMGSVVGEKIARATDKALENRFPLVIVSTSGGARMQEAALSLMQMAKTSARLARLADAKVPYISILTNPTTGGVTASFSMLGDIIFAEPGALIGFAGPRVIKQTIGQDLPAGFQRSEFLLKHGFIDSIVHRKNIKEQLWKVLDFFQNVEQEKTPPTIVNPEMRGVDGLGSEHGID